MQHLHKFESQVKICPKNVYNFAVLCNHVASYGSCSIKLRQIITLIHRLDELYKQTIFPLEFENNENNENFYKNENSQMPNAKSIKKLQTCISLCLFDFGAIKIKPQIVFGKNFKLVSACTLQFINTTHQTDKEHQTKIIIQSTNTKIHQNQFKHSQNTTK